MGRVSRGGDDTGEESNGTANKHTAMGFQRGVPATQPGIWVPQDSQVARRGRGIHNEVKRFPLAERPATVYKPGWARLAMASYLVPPELFGKMSANVRCAIR